MHHDKIYEKKYVWEFPIRAFHWINFVCIIGLIITGFLIGNPPAILSELEASEQFWFGKVRMIHFILAYVWVFNFIFRIYWGFVGSEYVQWKNWNPFSKAKREELKEVLKVDITLYQLEGKISLGHNPLAILSYWIFFLVTVLQLATGFAYYSQMSNFWLPKLFTWLVPLFGGEYNIRMIHHITTWFFIIFFMIHVYIVFYHDYIEGRGTMSSIVSGWKFIPKEKE